MEALRPARDAAQAAERAGSPPSRYLQERQPAEKKRVAVKRIIQEFLYDDSGLTTVEYAVAGALITIALVAAFTSLGTQVDITIDTITDNITPP